MKLAVLTYYDRNYVVDTSFASSAKISFYILMKSSSIYSLKAKENVIQ